MQGKKINIMSKIKDFIKKFLSAFHFVEKAFLIFFLGLMVSVAFLQIILRNFFTAIDWFDMLLKYCVLWAGMIAACIATHEDKHIKIDIIGRFTKGKVKQVVITISNLFATIVCIILFINFVFLIIQVEYPSPDNPPFLNIKKWILLLILPFSFFVMSTSFLIHTIKSFRNVIFYKKEIEEKTEGNKC